VGQFCTNPGIIIGPDGPGLDRFMETLASAIADMQGQPMLHRGIAQGYVTRKSKALAQSGVTPIAEGLPIDDALSGVPSIATVDGRSFIGNPILHEEVFGPFSLVVRCRDVHEMLEACRSMEGQLTATVMGTEDELAHHPQLLEAVASLCGRIILNGVPTGVEVCLSMQHGGPYPACTDSRFTSVGADGIKRFARPQAYQNWPDALLPEALKDGNPLGLLRTVDDRPAREALSR
jgi:NADP-dependent aldehyde dehydrogenase